MIDGARKLPAHHVTIRVPWHDDGWGGTVCRDPRANTQCLILPRVGTSKNDQAEAACAGRRLDELPVDERPPCIDERVSFMAPTEIVLRKGHPYRETSPDTHGHFAETPLRLLPFSAGCVPFRWMLRRQVEGDAERGVASLANDLKLGYVPEREPKLSFESVWVQDRENQLVMLDTFFGALKPTSSLCFFYAKRTPLLEDNRRVIVGVGRVQSIGDSTEYRYSTPSPPLRGVLWERCVIHSVRNDFADGFLFPYRELLELAERDQSLQLEEHVAFAPSEFFAQFSFASELLSHEGAIASLLACAASLRRIRERLPGSWDGPIAWIDRELDRLWKARGGFPGLGPALCAFGLEHGNLIAYELASMQERDRADWKRDPWRLVDAVMEDPAKLPGDLGSAIGKTFREKWRRLPKPRRALLELLSRCELSTDQATRYYQNTERQRAGIDCSDGDLTENPYLLFEKDRKTNDPISFGTVDRGLFPEEIVRKAFPVPAPSALTDAIDVRRVRALVIDTLEQSAQLGDTLLPRSWVVQRVRDREMIPPCPLDEDTLSVAENAFTPLVVTVAAHEGKAFQLDRYAETRSLISGIVRRRRAGARRVTAGDWRRLVDQGISQELPTAPEEAASEERARTEKAAALEELYASRLSVLTGPAGTGKTTLLKVLCSMNEVARGGVLLLAPTGKARVRLEDATGKRGAGRTIAQFLNALDRYDGSTGRYYPNSSAPKSADHKTVVVDECSMLTEEQLAALLDALQGVERLVLVGDPRQLPPIGAGRPFVDLVDEIAPKNVETMFPKCGPGYAELTIERRQQGGARDDLLLAAHFSGRPIDPGADEVWDRLASGDLPSVRLVQWSDSADLEMKLLAEIVSSLKLASADDEAGFEVSIGGSVYEKTGGVFFWAGRNGQPGAASKAEEWQILSPLRGALHVTVRWSAPAVSLAEAGRPWIRPAARSRYAASCPWARAPGSSARAGARRFARRASRPAA